MLRMTHLNEGMRHLMLRMGRLNEGMRRLMLRMGRLNEGMRRLMLRMTRLNEGMRHLMLRMGRLNEGMGRLMPGGPGGRGGDFHRGNGVLPEDEAGGTPAVRGGGEKESLFRSPLQGGGRVFADGGCSFLHPCPSTPPSARTPEHPPVRSREPPP